MPEKSPNDGEKVEGLAPTDSPMRPDEDASPTAKPTVEEAKRITGRTGEDTSGDK